MPTYGYVHIHLRSPDPAATAEWYHRMFDAGIIETIEPPGRQRTDIDINGLMVFIAGALHPARKHKDCETTTTVSTTSACE
ncbi:MAG: hypothetical protein J4F46_11155 [Dehalococcoidia bacterium]|nr:hypothetical protein [Dehalococcoidia bacterium]